MDDTKNGNAARPKLPIWLAPCILLTALLASYSIYQRYQAESMNRAASMAVEYDVVASLAASQGMPLTRALGDLKAQGVNALVISEETVADLIYQGKASVGNGGITIFDADSQMRVRFGVSARYPHVADQIDMRVGQPFSIPSLDMITLRQTPIGLNPGQVKAAKAAGMIVVTRNSNVAGATAAYVSNTLTWANALGATVFLPQGDQVLGRRDSLRTTVETLRRLGMYYASPEFTKLGGDDNVVREAPEIVVRLHSAQSAELDKMPFSDAVDRYARAARERNMRLLLLRPVSFSSEQPLTAFADFAKKINDQIRAEGGEVGIAKPFGDSNVPKWLILAIALSVVPTAYFVGASFVRGTAWRIGGLAIVAALAAASWTHSGRPFMALAAAIVFPIAAFLILDARDGKSIVLEFLIVTLVSLVGGLVVAGMLNGLPFFVRAETFPGVKLAVFLPIVVVGIYFFSLLADIRGAMASPVTWGAALLALAMLVALAFMASRTGNDNPAGVSDLEIKFRNVLDAVLFVRPRTKEFLIGHPLLIIGIGMLLRQRRTGDRRLGGWAALALTGGAIGQTDVVNTLCHLHTPVLLSLERIGVGAVAGCIIGMVLWAVVGKFLPREERMQEG